MEPGLCSSTISWKGGQKIMDSKSPIGLLSIRDSTGKQVKIAAFEYYQNAVDYLAMHAQPRNWRKTDSDTYETKTGYVVSVFMAIPNGIDLTKERYLDDQEGQETTESARRTTEAESLRPASD